MQAHNNSIEEFLGVQRSVFAVPVYQRNYDWMDGNCQQLFNDIVKSIETGKPHFLGTICFKLYNSHERSIIDGQQRLTSITLMLRAVYDLTSNDELKREINSSYIFNSGHSIDNDYLRVKLHLNERDDATYRIILNNTHSTVKGKLTAVQRESRVYQNYRLFLKLVGDYLEKGGKEEDILDSLGRLTIIELEIQDENPQEIFESLNSTGLDLSNVDLLRNYLLMQFAHEEQTELYHEYWSKIEDSVGVDNMESFFVDYLVYTKRSDALSIGGHRSHINERNLYQAFKDYYVSYPGDDDYEKTKAIFSDMRHCAELYNSTVFLGDVNLESETPVRKKLYLLLEVNQAANCRSLLLYLLSLKDQHKITDADYEESVDTISSFVFRSRVCNGKGFNRQFAGNVMIRLQEIKDYSTFTQQFWSAITFGKGASSFPTDENFVNALINNDMYTTLRSRGTKYLLYLLEQNSPYHKGMPAYDDKTITIEHILPQTLNPEWKTYLGHPDVDNYQTHLHRLGNLVLTSYNSEMSNKSFEEKKSIYADSNFYYTRNIQEYSRWDLSAIEARTKILAKQAINIWKFPKEYQKSQPVHESLHTLDEDFSQFSYTKPKMLYVEDQEFPMSSWNEVLPVLFAKMREENEEIFSSIATPEAFNFFYHDNEEGHLEKSPDYTCAVEDVYYRTNRSAYSTLDAAAKTLKAFDKKAGTDLYSNVMFSLK